MKLKEMGFLKGSFPSLDQVTNFLGTDEVLVNRRFVLLQSEKQKPRAIDDCRTSGLNSARSSVNKLILEDLD